MGLKLTQALRYVDKFIPHIPVQAKGLRDSTHYVLTTTNWQPYTWSLNNVVLAENLHTCIGLLAGQPLRRCLPVVEKRIGRKHVPLIEPRRV